MAGPVQKFRYSGVEAAIWSNSGPEGKTYYSVSVSSNYKDKNTGEWKQSSSLKANQLLTAGELLVAAWNWIREQPAQPQQQEQPRPQSGGADVQF